MTSSSSHIINADIDQQVQQELLEQLFAGAVKPNIFISVSAVVIFFSLKSVIPIVPLTLWTAAMCTLAAIRFMICFRYQKTTQPAAQKTLIQLYLLFTTAVTFNWAALPLLPEAISSPPSLLFVYSVIVGLMFIGFIVLAMHLEMMIIYITVPPISLIYTMFSTQQTFAAQLSALLIVYLVAMAILGKQNHTALIQALTLQFTNNILIKKLEKAVENESKANLAKSNFLANMSHEIRTPMNGIMGMTRVALDKTSDKEQGRILENVLYSAENLLGILNDILDFSKIEAGKLTFSPHDFSLSAMVDNLLSGLSYQAAEKDIFLRNKVDFTQLPPFIHTDELRLRQILTNLVGNAVKFTNSGGVTLKIAKEMFSEKSLQLSFTVTDTGIGIAPEKQETIFMSFDQADTSTTRQFGGTGLGLAISKQLVEMMGGQLKLESTPGQGSTFYFTIPVLLGKRIQTQSTMVQNQRDYSNLRILLVEDNLINQDLARIVLEKHNPQTIAIAENGLEALQQLSENDFDLILMDMQMPQMDGLTATTIIRKCERGDNHDAPANIARQLLLNLKNKHIPVVAMTANAMESDRQKCKNVGMDAYLSKPFMPEDVYRVINQLDLPGGDRTISANLIPQDNLKKQAFTYLQATYNLDDETVYKLLNDACADLAELEHELSANFSSNKLCALQSTAHSINDALLNLGLVEYADEAKRIELAALENTLPEEEIVTALSQKLIFAPAGRG